MPHQLLEGKADTYQHFLSSEAKISLVEFSDDFHFRIQTIESPTLLVRHISTYGQATNQGELSDAFFALMLSFHPGGYSSTDPLSNAGPHPPGPTLHWHLANCSCVSHHCNSKVTYLRLESAALLRELSAQAITVSQLNSLQSVAAPASLVHLIEDLAEQLAYTDLNQHLTIIEAFFNRLGQELRHLLGPPTGSDANAAGHISITMAWMMSRLSESISLQKLAKAIGLTPRSVQACFKNSLGISPMRWLKLARMSQLRQYLWSAENKHLSIKQMMGLSGLSDTSLNRQCYKNLYGVSPREERHQREAHAKQQRGGENVPLHLQFESLKAAIQYLNALDKHSSDINRSYKIIMLIKSITDDRSNRAAKKPSLRPDDGQSRSASSVTA